MSPEKLVKLAMREAPLLRTSQDIASAVDQILDSGLPALPVVDASGRLCGIFGEREFIAALFPGYLRELRSARFVSPAIDELLQRRAQCRDEPVSRYMTTDHVDVAREPSDAQIAETFLHHRVLILPVVDGGRVVGVITRSDFFRALAERFIDVT
jgi:CBS domain-containing protein